MRVVNLEDDHLDDVEVVVGVGILADFGQQGYTGITASELYTDVVLDNQDWDNESIISKALPNLLPHNSNLLPVYKYLSQCDGDLPDKVEAANNKNSFDDLLSTTIKKNRDKHIYRQETVASIRNKISASKCLQVIPHLIEKNIDVDELHDFLKSILTDKPSVFSTAEQGFKTDLKRVIRIFDWLKYKS